MSAVLRMEVSIPGKSGTEMVTAPGGIPSTANPLKFFVWLATLFSGFVSGLGARVRIGVEESTPTAATGTVVFTQASLTAGDKVIVSGPLGTATYTAVAGTAVAASGQFSKDTSDTAVGDSFVLALAAYPPNRPLFTGVNTAGSVALTATHAGVQGNAMVLSEVDASGGIALTQPSGGRDAGSLQSIVGTYTGVPADGGTLTIASVVLTVAAAPANESEFDGGATAAAAATNLIACINAHSKLKGLILASSGGSGVVNMQLLQTGRIGALIPCVESMTNYTQTATSWAPTQTSTWVQSPQVYAVGSSTTAQA